MNILGRTAVGDEPVTGDGDVAHHFRSLGLFFFPAGEVDGAGEGRHHDELGEGDAGFESHLNGGVEGGGLVGRQPEDERAEDVDAVLLERLELARQGLAGVVEVLEDCFQAFGSDGFYAYEVRL